jgi:hypothetical protein
MELADYPRQRMPVARKGVREGTIDAHRQPVGKTVVKEARRRCLAGQMAKRLGGRGLRIFMSATLSITSQYSISARPNSK